MNAPDDTMIEPLTDAPRTPVADHPTSRLLVWSIRRELWENRSTYLAPLIVAAVMLVGVVMGARRLKDAMRAIIVLDSAQQADLLTKPLGMTAVPIIITTSLVALFYCLDALHGERRDRSILFWKSLPVSDFVTVLSKALVPLVVLPVIAILTFIALHLLILMIGSVVLVTGGLDGTVLWAGGPLIRLWGELIYGIVGLSLWYAPLYGWLLLISGWAKRSAFLWAVLPPLALCLIEKIAFDTNLLWIVLKDRLVGFVTHGFAPEVHGRFAPEPLALLADPGLWAGLVVAALSIAAAVWFRRYRQPI